jgi:hypothetical protein
MASRSPKPDYKNELAEKIEIFRLGKLAREAIGTEGRKLEQKAFEAAKTAEQGKKIPSLARHYGVTLSSGLNPIDPEKLQLLLLRLAEDHVEGFQIKVSRKGPKKLSKTDEEIDIFVSVQTLMSERKIKVNKACELIAKQRAHTKRRNGEQWTKEGIRSIHRRFHQPRAQKKK